MIGINKDIIYLLCWFMIAIKCHFKKRFHQNACAYFYKACSH